MGRSYLAGRRKIDPDVVRTFDEVGLSGLANIVSTTDLVACVPRTLSRVLASRQDVRAVELPFGIEPLEIAQFWHERYQRDEAHHWLRAMMYRLFHDPPRSSSPTGPK